MRRPLSILVVGDNVGNADALAELLAIDDHMVKVARSGQDAVDAYRAVPCNPGFFDVKIPGKNGVECFHEILSERPDARIYFMTGYSADDMLKKAIDGGARGVFDKPVDLANVLEAVEQVARKSNAWPSEGSCRWRQ